MSKILTSKQIRLAAGWVLLAMFLGVTAVSGRAAAAGGAFIKPVSGPITLRFEAKYHDFAAAKNRTHHGIDIAAAAGSRVSASADGKIVFAGQTPVGLCVSILHSSGIKTTYLPLAATYVSRGDTVSQGKKIGTVGAFGDLSSSAAHLHMGAVFAGEYIDPEALLSGEYRADLTKLIRRGNISPGVGAPVLAGVGRLESWPVVSAVVRFLKGGGRLVFKAWGFVVKTGSFLASQAEFLLQTGFRWFKKSFLGFGGVPGPRRLSRFAPSVLLNLRRPVVAGAENIAVFDPSGDRSAPESRLFIPLPASGANLDIGIYDSGAVLVKRLDNLDRAGSGACWFGDDSRGRIVEPGIYSVVIKLSNGSARVILAEVRWHL